MTAFTVILFFVVIALGHAVNVSMEVMKSATTALMKIPSILLSCQVLSIIHRVPVIVTILNVAVFCFFVWSYTLTLSSDLTLTDYTNEIMGTIGDYIRIICCMSSLQRRMPLQWSAKTQKPCKTVRCCQELSMARFLAMLFQLSGICSCGSGHLDSSMRSVSWWSLVLQGSGTLRKKKRRAM